MEIVTVDLGAFGSRELRMAAEILTAFCKDRANLGDGVTLNFNRHSGCVFLADEDFNTAMMNGDRLEAWYSCPECGEEGFLEDVNHGDGNEACEDWCEEVGAATLRAQDAIKRSGAGSVSSGTLRTMDLVDAFSSVLGTYRPARLRAIEQEFPGEDADEVEARLEALVEALEECAPEGYTFGAHEGDGADFGFWPAGDEA